MRLKFIGWQGMVDGTRIPLWNVKNSPKPWLHPDDSTLSIEGWKELL
jgi:hypothetical protein